MLQGSCTERPMACNPAGTFLHSEHARVTASMWVLSWERIGTARAVNDREHVTDRERQAFCWVAARTQLVASSNRSAFKNHTDKDAGPHIFRRATRESDFDATMAATTGSSPQVKRTRT